MWEAFGYYSLQMIAATMITKKTVWFIVLSISTLSIGITDFSCDTTRPFKDSDVTCRCVSQNNIEWQLNDVLLSTCATSGACLPKPTGYLFPTDSSMSDKEYNLTVQGFDYSSCTVYSCTDLDTSQEQKSTLSIAAFDSTSPSVFVEPGVNQNGKIEITTECLFKESDITVEWYYVIDGSVTEVPYTPGARFQTPTDCTDTCNGEAAVRLNIGFTYTEEGSQIVKFGLRVYHKEDTANVLDLQTSSKYKIKAPTPEPDCCCCLKDCIELDKGVCILVCIIIYFFASLGVGIIAGMVVEAICHIWEGMDQKWRIASFFALLFGLGLFLCDLIRQRCEASKRGRNDPTNNSPGDVPLNTKYTNPPGGHAQPDHAQPLQDRPVNFN